MYFTNVRLIKELSEETRRQSRLRHLIILLIRILMISALVIAFAGPYIPVEEGHNKSSGRKLVSIYLDNSYSMEMRDADNILLETAKSIIPRVTETYSGDDLFRLYTNSDNPAHQHLMSAEELIAHSAEVSLSPDIVQLSEVTDRFKEIPEDARSMDQEIYILSDLQKSSADITNLVIDSTTKIRMLPFTAENHDNIYPDSCWFTSPVNITGQALKLKTRIHNTSGKSVEKQSIQLFIDGKQKAVTTIDIPAEGFAIAEFVFVDQIAGTKAAEIKITDYPVTYDDSFYFTYTTIDKIHVLAINGQEESRYLKTLFENDSMFFYRSISAESMTLSFLKTFDLIILNEISSLGSGFTNELLDLCEKGKSIAIIPGQPSEKTSLENAFGYNFEDYADTSRIRMNTPELQSEFYRGIFNSEDLKNNKLPSKTDMPYIKAHQGVILTSPEISEELLTLSNGDIFLWRKPVGSGWVYGFTSPMQEYAGNFISHALFVPVMYRMAFISSPAGMEYVTIGEDQGIIVNETPGIDPEKIAIVSKDNDYQFIPGIETTNNAIYLHFYENIKASGYYNILSNGSPIHSFAANYSRPESDLICYTPGEAEQLITDNDIEGITVLNAPPDKISTTLQELNEGQRLWHYFVYLCLLFLLAEGILLRIWK